MSGVKGGSGEHKRDIVELSEGTEDSINLKKEMNAKSDTKVSAVRGLGGGATFWEMSRPSPALRRGVRVS